MPLKVEEPAESWREIDRWEHGVGWIAHPEEAMQRASHAFEVDGDVWVVDPVDAVGIDDLLAEFGDVAGVVLLLDRHKRDAATIANRHGVAVHVPHWMEGVAEELDAPVERFRTELADTGYGVHPIVNNRFWREGALYGEETGQLIVPEALGTGSFYVSGGERLGVHAVLRLFPPKRLRRFEPTRLDVGHGDGLDTDVAAAIDRAIDRSRRSAPRLWASVARGMISG